MKIIYEVAMSYNAISFITLYKKEVQRFTKIPLQTIVAPAGTSLLFLVIFTTAIGSVRTNYPLDSFKSFLVGSEMCIRDSF